MSSDARGGGRCSKRVLGVRRVFRVELVSLEGSSRDKATRGDGRFDILVVVEAV